MPSCLNIKHLVKFISIDFIGCFFKFLMVRDVFLSAKIFIVHLKRKKVLLMGIEIAIYADDC